VDWGARHAGDEARVDVSQGGSLSELKRYEDALDAVVCCWVGMEYIARSARPYGDGLAAIWCPTVDPQKACAQVTVLP
jgi:predicted RNase H-like nuclease